MLTVLALFFLLSACSEDKSADMGQGKTAASTADMSESTSGQSGGMSSSHPVLNGIEPAAGVVYYDEIYAKWPKQ